MIKPKQKRYVDPFKALDSHDINKRLKSLFPSGISIIYGCDIIANGSTNITLTNGLVICDYVLIELLENVTLDLSQLANDTYFIVGKYKFSKSRSNDFKIEITNKPCKSCIIFAKIVVEYGELRTIDLSCRTKNELLEKLNNTDTTINGDLDLHGHKIINLANCLEEFNDTDAINLCYLKKLLNSFPYKIRVTPDDVQSDFLDPKIITNTYIHKEIVTDDNGRDFLKLSADDSRVLVIDGDSTEGYLAEKLEADDPLLLQIDNSNPSNKLKLSLDIDHLQNLLQLQITRKFVYHFNNESVLFINHKLNTIDVTVSIFDLSNHMILADDVEIIDENNIKITFTAYVSGKVVIRG